MIKHFIVDFYKRHQTVIIDQESSMTEQAKRKCSFIKQFQKIAEPSQIAIDFKE